MSKTRITCLAGGGARPRKREPEPEPEEAPLPDDITAVERETNDEELRQWGEKHIPGFIGVVARSDLETLYPPGYAMKPGTSCILNMDYGQYQNGGTHWVGMRVGSEEPAVLYFDSYGAPPPKDVAKRARADGRTPLYSDVMYQGLDETNCGPRALAALKMLADGAAAGKEMASFAELAGEPDGE